MIEPGRIIGAYVVEARAGAGGMAEVWRVRHHTLGSPHALKVLRPELAADPELRARFLAEGRVQAQVRHPHIAVVTDVVVEDGVAALVMELLLGGTLEARLQEGALPWRVVVDLLVPVCEAVDTLHARGIVHRDLKSSNLIFRDTARTMLAVSDFGVARVEDGALQGGRSHRTRTGHLLGTPAYMSPEQVRGRPVDGRSDVFSLGVVAWEMLTGALPFEAESDFETMAAIVEGRRAPLRTALPEAPEAIVAAVERALVLDVGGRWPSALAFGDALRGAASLPDGPRAAVVPPVDPSLPRVRLSPVQRPERAAEAPAGEDPTTWRLPEDDAPVTRRLPDVGEEPITRRLPEIDEAPNPRVPSPADDPPARGGVEPPETGPRSVAEPPTAPPTAVSAPPARRRGCFLPLFGCATLLTLGLSAAVVQWAWVEGEKDTAREEARRVVERLRQYKTDPDLNRDPAILDDLALRAEAAVHRAPVPQALGARALVEVWRQRWHYGSSKLDPKELARVQGLVAAAEVDPTPASTAAAAFLSMARCRLGDDPEPACRQLQVDVRRALDRIDQGWLREEVIWAGVLGDRAQAERLLAAGDTTGGRAWLKRGADLCRPGVDGLADAPVNGRFLLQSCVMLTGWLGEQETWLRQADQLVAMAPLEGDNDRLRAIYRGAAWPCAGDQVGFKWGSDGRPSAWKGKDTGGWGDWCVWMGRTAEGCGAQAEQKRPQECALVPPALPLPWSQPHVECGPRQLSGVPWDEAEQAVASTASERVARCGWRR